MAGYLLDSNAFLNFKSAQEKLKPQTLQTIEDPYNHVAVSLASIWEMGIKAANGKLPDYAALISGGTGAVEAAVRESGFEFLAVTLRHALAAPLLPQHHRDPFDRMLIAQALEEDLILISSDRIFERYPGLRVLRA
ncbi:MAG: type II toxin-antitoxin system VapC family toxin [Alphaproteobacteria bacterium]|nr:type II toxin-antitoxin system VapC family toxin [Alphaproteobacteria bacterium]